MILFSWSLPNILNDTNDCNTALQIASKVHVYTDLNGTRVVNTNLKLAYFSLQYKGKNVSQLLQLVSE